MGLSRDALANLGQLFLGAGLEVEAGAVDEGFAVGAGADVEHEADPGAVVVFVVGAAVGAAGDLIVEGVNGFLFSTGDVRALSGYLERLVCDPPLRARFGQKSREIIEHWSYRENLKGILTCLEQLPHANPRA